MKSMASLVQLSCALALLLQAAGVTRAAHFPDRSTEPTKFTSRNVGVVTPAKELFESAPLEFKSGQQFDLLLKQNAKVKSIVAQRLSARFFRLSETGDKPEEWQRIGDCWVYFFVKYNLVASETETQLRLLRFEDTWLNVIKGQPIKAGRFKVVFEEGWHDDETENTFRLHKDSVNKYFDNGLVFEVKPAGEREYNQQVIDKILKEQGSRTENQIRVIDENSKKYNCYKYRSLPVGSSNLDAVGALALCDLAPLDIPSDTAP